MNAYVKPDFDVMEFVPDEYVSSCDGEISANVTCTHGGSISLTGGYHNGNGLYSFPTGQQLYTDVYKSIDGEKDTSILGVLVGTISDGHHPDTTHPRQDGEYSNYGESSQTIYCAHAVKGTDAVAWQQPQHHHLETVLISNHS